jgi:glycosyltransferase involved in cell wall biosynthesis
MAKRTRLGIIYSYNENWIGGTYYIHNLLKALLTIPIELRPSITILTESEEQFIKLKNEVGYQELSYFPLFASPSYTIIERIINKLGKAIFKYQVFNKNKTVVDIAFPVLTAKQEQYGKKKIYWIPDFQDHKQPNFFTEEERKARADWQLHISNQKQIVVFSSEDALSMYKQLYPNHKTYNKIVSFASIHSFNNLPLKKTVTKKYSLPEKYFMCPNQFWAHKNHIVVIKALQLLKQEGLEVTAAFTGKEHDYRNPDYFSQLQRFVITNGLQENIKFLGFIDRQDQLALIKYANAIIQPSLCEGWSTVIEDAKALNKKVIASNLDVHQEQLGSMGTYFNSLNERELADILKQYYYDEMQVLDYQYEQAIQSFGKNFISAISA